MLFEFLYDRITLIWFLVKNDWFERQLSYEPRHCFSKSAIVAVNNKNLIRIRRCRRSRCFVAFLRASQARDFRNQFEPLLKRLQFLYCPARERLIVSYVFRESTSHLETHETVRSVVPQYPVASGKKKPQQLFIEITPLLVTPNE